MTAQPRRKPTISAIKAAQPNDYFFGRDAMRFFGQRMRDFHVDWDSEKGAWRTTARMRDRNGRDMGPSVHHFDAETLVQL